MDQLKVTLAARDKKVKELEQQLQTLQAEKTQSSAGAAETPGGEADALKATLAARDKKVLELEQQLQSRGATEAGCGQVGEVKPLVAMPGNAVMGDNNQQACKGHQAFLRAKQQEIFADINKLQNPPDCSCGREIILTIPDTEGFTHMFHFVGIYLMLGLMSSRGLRPLGTMSYCPPDSKRTDMCMPLSFCMCVRSLTSVS